MVSALQKPWSAEIWDEVETWSRDRIEDHQLTALQQQLARVQSASGWYGREFREAGFDARDLKSLDDIRKLPLTRKSDYVRGLAEKPPFGSFAAVGVEEAVRIHFSSGTTGKPTPVLWTRNDIERWADIYARYLYAQGLRRNDVMQCMYNFAWFVGGLGATMGAQRVGALVIPAGAGDTARQIETILDYGTKCLVGTPSFMAHVAETAASMGVDLAASTVSVIGVGGEPGASVPATRQRLEKAWGARMFDCYGALEFQPVAWETAGQFGPVLAEDEVYAEILDAVTEQPVEDGERGVLVLTHLRKEACPLVRWWTGDVVVRDRRPMADGRTHGHLPGGVLGRADDMLVIRGVNLFPTAIENVVRSVEGTTNEYQLVIDESVKDPKSGFLTGVKLRIEATPDAPADLVENLTTKLKEKLQVRFKVDVLPAGTLPRTVHKAKRLVME